MGRDVQSPGATEKERIRFEIENQVEQFLQKGGRIDVLSKDGSHQDPRPGWVWQNHDDDIGLPG